jgi:hypothetical protein
VQYLPVAFVMTVCGAGIAPAIAARMKSRRAVISGMWTLALLAAVALLWDFTSQFRPNMGSPVFLLLHTYGLDIFVAHLKTFVVPAVLSSAVVWGDRKNHERQSWFRTALTSPSAASSSRRYRAARD